MISRLKGFARQAAVIALLITLAVCFFWMLACVMTLFSVSKYFTVGHFILAAIVACIAGQWLNDLGDKPEP
nr:hypothetical protein [uncultured Pseudomonas sp.]